SPLKRRHRNPAGPPNVTPRARARTGAARPARTRSARRIRMAKRGRRERACGPVPLAAGGRYDAALCVVLVVLLFGCGVVAPAGGDDASILRYVNAARAEARRCGERSFARAAPVAWNTRLAAAARRH